MDKIRAWALLNYKGQLIATDPHWAKLFMISKQKNLLMGMKLTTDKLTRVEISEVVRKSK